MATDVSVLGRGTRVRGRISGGGDLEVHGHLEGEVGVDGEVLIEATAVVAANVAARRIVVRGAVRGDLVAEDAVLLERGARVVGDLRAPRVGIAEGALVRGLVQSGDAPPAAAAARGRAAQASTSRDARVPAARASEPRPVERVPAVRASEPRPVERPAARAPAPAVTAAPVRNGLPRPSVSLVAGGRLEDTGSGSFDFDNAPTVARSSNLTAQPATARASGGPPPPVVPALKKGAKGQIAKKRN